MPNLLKLDGLGMTDKDQARVCQGQKPLTWELLMDYFRRTKKSLGELEMDGTVPRFTGWERSVEDITIQKMQINKIQNV